MGVFRLRRTLCLLALAAAGSVAAAEKDSAKKGVEACAREELKRMSDFLGQQKQFSLRSEAKLEGVVEGKRETIESVGQIAVKRPNMLRMERTGGALGGARVHYDGKMFSVIKPGADVYASVPAPPTLDLTLDVAADALGWVPPGADLLYSDSYSVLMGETTKGKCLGQEQLDGKPVERLAFEGPSAKWEVWIEKGKAPLPKKFEVTSKDESGEAKYSVLISEWNLDPKLKDESFVFKPPEGAEKVAFMAAPKEQKEQKPKKAQGRKGEQR